MGGHFSLVWSALSGASLVKADCCSPAGRSKGKQAGDKLPLLAVQCLDALLRLGRTSEGVAELLQEVMVPADVEPAAASTGETMHHDCFQASAAAALDFQLVALDRAMYAKETDLQQACFLTFQSLPTLHISMNKLHQQGICVIYLLCYVMCAQLGRGSFFQRSWQSSSKSLQSHTGVLSVWVSGLQAILSDSV